MNEFHSILDEVSSLGGNFSDLTKLNIPSEEIGRVIVSYQPDTGESTYSEQKYVARSVLMGRIDSAITYLELLAKPEDKKKMIGFTA